MQWETTTTQEENPMLIFKMNQSISEVGLEESAKKLDNETGPIAVIFDKEEGWIGEKLGPRSGHWKRLARKVQNKAQKEEACPEKLKRQSNAFTRARC